MYRKLEEHREPKTEEKVRTAEVECFCQCKAPAEKGKEAKPAGNLAGTELGTHLEQNG